MATPWVARTEATTTPVKNRAKRTPSAIEVIIRAFFERGEGAFVASERTGDSPARLGLF
jgi:hypothetical protein